MTQGVFIEKLHREYAQQFVIDKVLYERNTEHFHCIIFENPLFGRVMALDGVIQTTEKDEFIYHEMLTHVPLFAHPRPQQILIVGGGDGGMLREVLRHKTVEKVTLVEIDDQVIEMSKRYFPNHSQGAFDDPRTEIVIQDGIEFVSKTPKKFDVIITDSTDPIGPGEVLFSGKFYRACQQCLAENGILVTQNGVAFFQLQEAKSTSAHLKTLFNDVCFYSAAIPTYVGGIMAFGFATDDPLLRQLAVRELHQRFATASIKTRYYTPEIHHAAFALPAYINEALR